MRAPLIPRVMLVCMVLFAHGWAFSFWVSQTPSVVRRHEMMAGMITVEAAVKAAPESRPPRVPFPEQHAATQTESASVMASTAVSSDVLAATALPAGFVSAESVAADLEPDYQAAYLHNPPPVYPMVARRMGWQGRVIIRVEVLANGSPGQIRIQQGSGHSVLDEAAVQAVKSWKFIAARQDGELVNKWFLVPIPFILERIE